MLKKYQDLYSLLLLLFVVLSAVSYAQEKVFAMVPKRASAYYEPCYEGFKAAGERYGVVTEYAAPESLSLPQQVAVIQNLIKRGVAGIAISALDNEGLVDIIAKATAAGIKVICFDADAPDSSRLSYIGTDNVAAGKTGASEMAKLLSNKGKVVLLQSDMQASNLNLRSIGFKEYLAQNAPDIEIIAHANIGTDKDSAKNMTNDLLMLYDNNIDGFFSVSAVSITGVAAALKDCSSGKKPLCAGFDTLPATIEGIKSGVIEFCLAQMTYKMGWLSLTELMKAVDGEDIPDVLDTGMMIVTEKNVQDYKGRIEKEAQAVK